MLADTLLVLSFLLLLYGRLLLKLLLCLGWLARLLDVDGVPIVLSLIVAGAMVAGLMGHCFFLRYCILYRVCPLSVVMVSTFDASVGCLPLSAVFVY